MADDAGDDRANAMADALLAHQQMEETQQYLLRGREFVATPRYAEEGVPLSLSTLADQVGACCAVLEPILIAFTRFLGDGRICLSNNAAERALGGIALGRKSWLFARWRI